MRLICDVTPSGRVRVLMTNLLDTCRYPADQFGALYHQRWRVEEAFKRIKHRLRLEAPTGLSFLAFQQDFAAKVLADNLCVLLAADQTRADPTSRPNRIYAMGCAQADSRRLPAGYRSCARELARSAGDDRPQPLSHPTRSHLPEAAESQAASSFGIQGGLS